MFSGKRSQDPNDPDWVPSIFTFTSSAKVKKAVQSVQRQQRYEHVNRKRMINAATTSALEDENGNLSADTAESQGLMAENDCDKSTQSDIPDREISLLEENMNLKRQVECLDRELRSRNEEVYKLREENAALQNSQFGYDKIKESDSLVNFFTGLATVQFFSWVVARVRGKVALCHHRLSVQDHVLIVLMKLRLGLMNKDIAYRFNLQDSVVSAIYRQWLPVIGNNLQNLITWPSRANIRKNLPQSFRSKFRDAVCTIDCSEVFIERPSSLTARAKTWSNYKHHNTIKYLIGISPAGAVSFLSVGFGGRASDKHITIKSGFINKLFPGDCVLADRGFLVQREINEVGATLKMPSFTKGKKQLSAKEVDESRQLARVRIHVERVIGRIKKFRILQGVIPITQADLLNSAMVTICAIVNLNNSIVARL